MTRTSVQIVSRWYLAKRKTSGMGCHSSSDLSIPHRHCNHSRGSSWQGSKYKWGQIQAAGQQPYVCSSCCWKSEDLEPINCGTNTGGGPKNFSRHSKHKKNRFHVFSSFPWLYYREMRSPSTTLSPQNKRRCGHITFPRYILPVALSLWA